MFFEKGNFYPPVEHEDRLKKYEENRLLFEGKHRELVDKYQVNPRGTLYVSVNLAGLISKKSADFLIGDGITISAGKEEVDAENKEQLALERIYNDNQLDLRLYESALGNSYRGDSFFKVRFGHEIEDTELGIKLGDKRAQIETIPAKYVFPETSPYNVKVKEGYHIAIPIRVKPAEDGKRMGDWELQVESHFPNEIIRFNRELAVVRTDVNGKPESWKIGDYSMEPKVETTNVPYPLVVHISNYSTDDSEMGLDDLSELKPMFDELNNRFSQIANILDKHSDPAMAVPSDVMEVDEFGRPIFKVAESKVFEISHKDDIIPQYITWNGQLIEAYSEVDRLTSEILTLAEIPEMALGKSEAGTSGSSGASIRMRMNSLLSKVNRKKLYYEEGLKRMLVIAQMVEHESGKEVDYEITVPKLKFTDGLPKDEAVQTSIYLQKSGGAILKSRKSSMMELEGMTGEQADAEIAQILKEEELARAVEKEQEGNSDVFNRLNAMYDNVNDNKATKEEPEEDVEDE